MPAMMTLHGQWLNLIKLACYVRVLFVLRHTNVNVNWRPSIVCGPVQNNIKRKVGITQRPDIHQGEELQLHDDGPVPELWRGLNLFHAPIAKGIDSVSSQLYASYALCRSINAPLALTWCACLVLFTCDVRLEE